MRILVYGSGSTGCYIAAQCIQAGADVTLIGRKRVQDELLSAGEIQISDFEGRRFKALKPTFETSLANINTTTLTTPKKIFDLCFISLKCHHLEAAKNDLITLSQSGCELHFLQNGVNAYQSVDALAELENTHPGIIPFNVVSQGGGRFHQGTEGKLQLSVTKNTQALARAFSNAKLEIDLYENMQAVIYGKLLLNLNNAINAISNIPLKTQLENRVLRKHLAQAMQEYIDLCKHHKWTIVTPSPIPPQHLPSLLKLPNFIFTRAAKRLLTIDPLARSSMWEDIQAGRKTEIEYLNGWVARECEKAGLQCPANKEITKKIKRLESHGR